MQPCRQGCGLGLLGRDMDYHCQNDCVKLEKECPRCEEKYYPKEDEKLGRTHDCIQLLKERLSQERMKNFEVKRIPQALIDDEDDFAEPEAQV